MQIEINKYGKPDVLSGRENGNRKKYIAHVGSIETRANRWGITEKLYLHSADGAAIRLKLLYRQSGQQETIVIENDINCYNS